jgi:hypothetical protein
LRNKSFGNRISLLRAEKGLSLGPTRRVGVGVRNINLRLGAGACQSQSRRGVDARHVVQLQIKQTLYTLADDDDDEEDDGDDDDDVEMAHPF